MSFTTMNPRFDTTTAGGPEDRRAALLRSALRENGLFSLATGAVLALGAGRLDSWLGLNTWLLVGLGLGLVLYGEAIWFGTRRELRLTGRLAVGADLGWVLGAALVIATTEEMTRNGELALGAVTVVVAALAVAQWLGLRRLGTSG